MDHFIYTSIIGIQSGVIETAGKCSNLIFIIDQGGP
jgi:hypothetical protein